MAGCDNPMRAAARVTARSVISASNAFKKIEVDSTNIHRVNAYHTINRLGR